MAVVEIQELLAVHGVTRIMLEYADGRPSGVMFEAATEFGLKPFRLPVDVDAMHQTAESREAGRAPAQDREHAERVAWRYPSDGHSPTCGSA